MKHEQMSSGDVGKVPTPAGAQPLAPVGANAMSVDVEDYFQVQAFAGVVSPADWDGFASRVEANTDRILAQFAAAGAKGTFFTLGWVAERHPALVRRIVAGGHELASHGFGHAPVHALGAAGFRADIRRAKAVLEDAAGVTVRGYRAPTFSMGRRTPWAHGILEEEGHAYSSSIFPIRHDLYGEPDAPRFAFQPAGGTLWELPMTTVRLGGRNFPCAGGGYFRLLPYALFRRGLRRVNAQDGRAGIFYFHPWEVDPGQPLVTGISRMARFRHYLNLGAMAGRLDRLLRDFAWDRIDRVFGPELGGPELNGPELNRVETWR
jgi:polysaccharide deacetylase family protein (PEP-CTERM system associated)